MSITLSDFIWSLINFIVLFGALGYFLWKPLTKMLNDRRNEIEGSLALAEKTRIESEQVQANLAAEIEKARKQAREIVEQAQQVGETVKADIVNKANEEASKKIEDAMAEIERKKAETIADLQSQVADLVVMVSEKVLSDGITDDQKSNLVNKYIKEVGGLQ